MSSYIGETGCPLIYRFREHHRSLAKHNLPSLLDKSFAKNRVMKHRNGILDLEIHILTVLNNAFKEGLWRRYRSETNVQPSIYEINWDLRSNLKTSTLLERIYRQLTVKSRLSHHCNLLSFLFSQ